MAFENNQSEGQTDIARFLEKFSQDVSSSDFSFSRPEPRESRKSASLSNQQKYQQSFEKLEEKIRELEDKFEASAAVSEAIMRELALSRSAAEENRKSKEAFMASISATIANLKESVENLSRAQRAPRLYDPAPAPGRAFDALPAAQTSAEEYLAMTHYRPENYRAAQQAKLHSERMEKEQALADLRVVRAEKERALTDLNDMRAEKDQALSALSKAQVEAKRALMDLTIAREEKDRAQAEKDRAQSDLQVMRSQAQSALSHVKEEREAKERIISSLQQKASQLKAVNVALDREIKRVQQEKMEALRKSAEQAKEILSLRDALTAAEERFNSFDFEGRIISIKRHYQHKVSTLENQLQEISNTCMKQVEEIEALKEENLKLHKVAEEREQLAALYEVKTRELEELQASVAQLRAENDNTNQARLAAFTHRMQHLQQEHEELSQRLMQAQQALQSVTEEKQTLEDNFKVLLGKIEQNDAVIEELKRKIAVLSQENQELKKEHSSTPSGPVSAPVVRQPAPVRHPLAKPAAPVRTATKAAQDSLSEPQSAPVEMQNTLHSKLQTDADLPEIRVADPVPQEDLYNGEDFLEKTDSFIGRMKWSIFREDK